MPVRLPALLPPPRFSQPFCALSAHLPRLVVHLHHPEMVTYSSTYSALCGALDIRVDLMYFLYLRDDQETNLLKNKRRRRVLWRFEHSGLLFSPLRNSSHHSNLNIKRKKEKRKSSEPSEADPACTLFSVVFVTVAHAELHNSKVF